MNKYKDVDRIQKIVDNVEIKFVDEFENIISVKKIPEKLLSVFKDSIINDMLDNTDLEKEKCWYVPTNCLWIKWYGYNISDFGIKCIETPTIEELDYSKRGTIAFYEMLWKKIDLLEKKIDKK